MQFGATLCDGRKVSFELEKGLQSTVLELVNQIGKVSGDQSYSSPRYAIHVGCKDIRWNDSATLESFGIREGQQFHPILRLCPNLYVQWHNAHWIQSKDTNCSAQFYGTLSDAFGASRNSGDTLKRTAMTNCTVWHVKKVVAKFVNLEPHEIDLYWHTTHISRQEDIPYSVYAWGGEPDDPKQTQLFAKPLRNEMLVDSHRDFVVTIAKSISKHRPPRSKKRLKKTNMTPAETTTLT